jgi:hypothetical protein
MDFEDGELTMKVKTTRLSNLAIKRMDSLAILLKYLRKQQTNVTFQDALDFAISFTDENYTQRIGNTPSHIIAPSNMAEIQPQTIPHEILQTEIPQQDPEPQPLQTASIEQTGYVSPTGLTIKELMQITKKNSDTKDIAPSKQDNVVEFDRKGKPPFVVKLLNNERNTK